jgi:sugar-specific transcriptional regulator TrmB
MRTVCLGFRKLPLWLVAAVLLAGCQSAYYGAMEKFGYEKRDILVNRVDDARDAQQDAKKQFESALAQFIAVTNFSGGELEQQYNKLKGEFDDSESRANTMRKRNADVERVAQDLFKEWEQELTQYTNPELRRSSQAQLDTTRTRYRELIGAMKRAERKLDPVLAAFRDRVLFLKHNLNARAIASLKTERAKIQADITTLVADMNRSIAEADRFIKDMSADKN